MSQPKPPLHAMWTPPYSYVPHMLTPVSETSGSKKNLEGMSNRRHLPKHSSKLSNSHIRMEPYTPSSDTMSSVTTGDVFSPELQMPQIPINPRVEYSIKLCERDINMLQRDADALESYLTKTLGPKPKPGQSWHNYKMKRDNRIHATPEFIRAEYEIYPKLEARLRKEYPTDIKPFKVCPWVPRTFEEWLWHLKDSRDLAVRYLQQRVANFRAQRHIPPLSNSPLPLLLPFGGKRFGSPANMRNASNVSPVLMRETIWTPHHNVPWAPIAHWPSRAEMEWEGPSRIQTEHGRYLRMLPLPRLPPGWPTYAEDYKVCPRVVPFAFDDVQPVPDFESIYFPPEAVDDEVGRHLVGSDIMDSVNDPIL